MTVLDTLSGALIAAGVAFFVTGTVGLIRFPDIHSRLHAVTKGDNLGLGLILLGLLPHARGPADVVKLVLIWLTVLIASACVCFLIANDALRRIDLEKGDPDG